MVVGNQWAEERPSIISLGPNTGFDLKEVIQDFLGIQQVRLRSMNRKRQAVPGPIAKILDGLIRDGFGFRGSFCVFEEHLDLEEKVVCNAWMEVVIPNQRLD
ncbi:hypothetical protein CPLU01_04809 [Colletotrichum plurivorum]|uniref:Uncharacterized protein n=1 Tax=Colletotrichum plurivorum TaxID=2175906 RepID=A0A8H6KNR8_9PEZI|nr:hypothetical protein CPLU01_04809 [Colletotrichum plurivorum]